jgi:hypothetical protein
MPPSRRTVSPFSQERSVVWGEPDLLYAQLTLVGCQNRMPLLSWAFARLLGDSVVLADQPCDGPSAADPGGHVDHLAGVVQRRAKGSAAMRTMVVVVQFVFGRTARRCLSPWGSAGRGRSWPSTTPGGTIPGFGIDGTLLRIGPDRIGRRQTITFSLLVDGPHPTLTCPQLALYVRSDRRCRWPWEPRDWQRIGVDEFGYHSPDQPGGSAETLSPGIPR